MKLICINASKITVRRNNGVETIHNGRGLVEGNTYETKAKPYIDNNGLECYYIVGLGSKIKSRFAEALDDEFAVRNIHKEISEIVMN